MPSNRVPIWLWAAIGLSVLLALYSIGRRHQVESRNKAVAITTEFEVVEALAAAQGISVSDALQKLKNQGLGGVVLSEETIGELIGTGHVGIVTNSWPAIEEPPRTVSVLQINDPAQVLRIKKGLTIRLGGSVKTLEYRDQRLNLPSISPSLVRSVPIGLDPEQVKAAKDAGLLIVGRYANPNGISSAGVRQTLAWAKADGVFAYLPMGDQVIGRRDATTATIDALRELGLLYASPEFAKIGGDANITAAAPELVIRLHSAQAAELDKLPLIDAVERYGRAARERNMRLLLLRPVSFGADQPLTNFGSFVADVTKQIKDEGGDLGIPKPFGEPDIPRWWPVLLALAAMPVVWYAFAAFHPSSRPIWTGSGLEVGKTGFGVAALLGLVALSSISKSGAQVATFAIALGYPVLGYLLLDRLRPRSVLVGFLIVSLLSFAGALCVAGMLNGLSYYIQSDEFRGVKLSVFLPIVLVGALFFMRLVDWRGTLQGPITWGTAGLGFIILVGLALMIARTGNDTGAGASSMELMLRNVLDRFLYVRPRTKEFLIGHPLLVIGVGMLGAYTALREKGAGFEERARVLGAWTTLVLMVSAVGQTSIVNTMSHMHIPVLLSIARIAEGLVIGCIIGLVVWALLSRAAFRVEN